MDTNRIQTPLLLTSYLFEYPSAEWWEGVPTHAAAVADVERPQSREVFEEFFGYIGETERQEFEDAYVRAFDFSQNTNLYLTTHNRTDFGKQSEEMLRYKQLFLDAGYDLERELPDY
ncbi:MAG: nitrate reductase molybdenum cofactor assembly chaperone, partial [Selenomonas massiliensis]